MKKIKLGLYKYPMIMLYYHLSSGSGGMADALDSGSSGSLSCESSSLFFRIELQAPDTEKQRYSGVFHDIGNFVSYIMKRSAGCTRCAEEGCKSSRTSAHNVCGVPQD